ncbi:hypothetical protein SETIT_3G400900v2 [Setaria italica]|uniref:Uncharacterized protein n=1 Tax=Setaria italica TaxID=4555 RepID=A0A368QP78_SETIT|nr:hypothetical protein SETIT_3G400900v2 [Setaria italica]
MALRSLARGTSVCALRCRSGAGMPSRFLATIRNLQVRPSRLRNNSRKRDSLHV